MGEKERASALERLAPKPTAQEMEEVNGLFRHFLFKRCGKGEIWTTCCRRHTFVKPDTDNADELRVLHAPHTPEPRSGWDHSPAVKRRCRCPYCGAEVTVKELRYSGGRANLWSFRRAVILRQPPNGAQPDYSGQSRHSWPCGPRRGTVTRTTAASV